MLRWCGFLAAGCWLAAAGSGCTTLRMSEAFAPPAHARSPESAATPAAPRQTSQPKVEAADKKKPARRPPAESTIQTAGGVIDKRSSMGPSRGSRATAKPDPSRIAVPDSSEVNEPFGTASTHPTQPAQRSNHFQKGVGTVSAWGHSMTVFRGPTTTVDGGAATPGDTAVITPADVHAETNASRNVAFGKLQAHSVPSPGTGPAAPGHSSPYRTETPTLSPEITQAAASAVKTPMPNPPGKANPILGYLLPGRFTGATNKAATPNGAAGGHGASVGVVSPRETSPNPAAQTPREAGSATTKSADDLLAALIARTEAETAQLTPGDDEDQKRTYTEKHVYLRMLYLMSGQPERALQAIPAIDVADQEFWQQTFWGLTNYFDAHSIPSSADRAAQTVSQLTKAVLRLQERANLDLRNVNFCHKIVSFGNYDKYPRDEFSPGQEVLLYAEVANIHSEPAADGKHRTSLKSTLEIYRYGVEGELVERFDLPETVDLCRTHRRDYFHSYQFILPPKLTLGPHVLKLTVEDQLTRRSTSYSLNFMVK